MTKKTTPIEQVVKVKTVFTPMIEIKVKKLHPDAEVPKYMSVDEDGNVLAVGMDVKSVSREWNPEINTWIYHTGLAFELPLGYAMLITPRSSNRKTDYYIPNTPGILDPGFGEELLINFKRRSDEKDHKMICELAEKVNAIETAFINHYHGSFLGGQLRGISRMYEHASCIPDAPYEVGDRCAQIFIILYPLINFIETDEIASKRSGFGSTGK